MAAVLAPPSPFAAAFRRHLPPLPAGALPWLDALRASALARVLERGLPTPRHEDWLSTNLAALGQVEFAPAPLATAPTGCATLDPVERALPGAVRYLLVDGRPVLPEPAVRPPAGLRVRTLAQALFEQPARLRPWLEELAASEHPFALLSVAFLGHGLWIETDPGATIPVPVVLQHVSTKDVGPLANHLAVFVVAGAGSRLTLLESVSGLGGAGNLTNTFARIQAEAGAHVEHTRVQREGPGAFHVSRLLGSLGAGAHLRSLVLSLGARLSRMETEVRFAAPGATCSLSGLYHVDGTRSADLVTRVVHAVPGATSRQLVKGVLDGEGHGAFTGRVEVAEGAAKTDAEQANHNLLLSARAQADSRPQLEIYADDVRCAHGATVGRLDETALFYLKSRGLGAEEARDLLVHAFAGEVLAHVSDARLRAALDGVLATLLHETRSPGRLP